MATTTSTNVKFLTGDINKLKDASSEAGAIIFAVDKTNKKGKIYYNADSTTRVEMTTDEAESAKKWSKAVDFTIHDAGDQHHGSAASVDGSSDVTLYLPDTISANLMGNVTGNLAGNVTGNLTGNVTGNLTGNVTGNVTGNLIGNADTATKFKTARDISVGTAVTSTATSFDGTKNIIIPINTLKESYLVWGGRNVVGDISPIGMSCSAEHSANRLAFINGAALTFEYSSDGGTTWTDYGYSSNVKSSFCTLSQNIPIGRVTDSEPYTTNSQTRITISAQSYVYTNPRKLLINISTGGKMQVVIEYKTGASNATWKIFGTYSLSGWSGWNDIPLILSTLGGGSSQTGNTWFLRLTFKMTAVHATHTNATVNAIRLFGTNSWTSASSVNKKGVMSSTGHLYSYDISANATFPAKVTATSFSGPLIGNATTADKWKTAVNFRISDSEVKHTGIDTLIDGSSTTGYTLHLPPTIEATLEGNASTATKWLNPQKVYVTLGTASTTTTIQGGSSSAQTIGVNGILGGANGGTGQSSWTANRLVYSSTTAKLANASSIYIDNNHIGINATTTSVSGNAYNLYVNGTTYLNGVLTSTSRIESINTTDSTYSKDEQAALVIEGGATIEKQLSAKQIRIDNNQAAKSCTLKFNETQNCLEFTFQ